MRARSVGELRRSSSKSWGIVIESSFSLTSRSKGHGPHLANPPRGLRQTFGLASLKQHVGRSLKVLLCRSHICSVEQICSSELRDGAARVPECEKWLSGLAFSRRPHHRTGRDAGALGGDLRAMGAIPPQGSPTRNTVEEDALGDVGDLLPPVGGDGPVVPLCPLNSPLAGIAYGSRRRPSVSGSSVGHRSLREVRDRGVPGDLTSIPTHGDESATATSNAYRPRGLVTSLCSIAPCTTASKQQTMATTMGR
jgi:hypothetical protein